MAKSCFIMMMMSLHLGIFYNILARTSDPNNPQSSPEMCEKEDEKFNFDRTQLLPKGCCANDGDHALVHNFNHDIITGEKTVSLPKPVHGLVVPQTRTMKTTKKVIKTGSKA